MLHMRSLFRQSRPRNPLFHARKPHIRYEHHKSHTGASPQTEPSPPLNSRITRLLNRLPRFLHRPIQPLLTAPVSHITSFFILHELTAIIPLFSLAAYFHYTQWLPAYFSEGKWVLEGVNKFGNYFRKKGWVSSTDSSTAQAAAAEGPTEEDGRGVRPGKWDITESGVRVIVEFATAYAVTKAFLPLRIVGSVWATPWFARSVVVPMGRAVRKRFGRGTKTVQDAVK